MKIVVTGIGVTSPVGNNKTAFWSALLKGTTGLGQPSRFSSPAAACGELRDFEFETLFPDRRFRRAASVSKYALVATREAIVDAGVNPEEELSGAGLAVGVTHGAIDYSCDFHRGIALEGPLGASPALFSDSVLNAATGSLSLAFGIKGPTHTLIGGSPVGLKAAALGAELISDGRADMCVVCAAEALNERVVEAYGKFNLVAGGKRGRSDKGAPGFVPSEGACAFVIESLDRANDRGVEPIAEVAGWGFSDSGPLRESLVSSLDRAYAAAGLDANGIGCVFAGFNGGAHDGTEDDLFEEQGYGGTPVVCVKRNTGESFGVASALSLAAAALSLKEGVIPPYTVREERVAGGSLVERQKPYMELDMGGALVSSTGILGEAGCMILKKHRNGSKD
ncbi:MAG: beta-ketoacyl synthase N-terminal-like domain-containing protein [Thermodesulfobacteriota bacterium]